MNEELHADFIERERERERESGWLRYHFQIYDT